MRAVFAALVVGAAVAFFALGALTSHYRTVPWPWLYSMVPDSKAALKSVRKKPHDRKRHADGGKKSFSTVIPSGLLNFDFVIQESQPSGRGGQRRATKLFGVQREPGTTVSLVTTSETLIAP